MFAQVKFATAFACSAALIVSTGAVEAATASFDDETHIGTCTFEQGNGPNDNSKTVNLSNVSSVDDVACFGGSGGSNQPSYSGGDPITFGAFDMTFTLAQKSDEDKGDGYIDYDDGLSDETPSYTTWSVTSTPIDVVAIALGFKQGNNYALFMPKVDTNDEGDPLWTWTGTWSIFDNDNKNNNYSHLDLWYKTGERPATDCQDPNGCFDPTPEPDPVPLPAAGWMLIAGVGGLAAMRRRRKT